MTPPITPSYAGHRFPPEVISHAVWLYFRFPLGLRMVEELLAARGITISHETVRQWALKFGQAFANQIRRRLPRAGDRGYRGGRVWAPTRPRGSHGAAIGLLARAGGWRGAGRVRPRPGLIVMPAPDSRVATGEAG